MEWVCTAEISVGKWCKIHFEVDYLPMAESDSLHHTRPSLLIRLRDLRDGEAWQTFVGTYAPLIYRYCRQRGVQDADAADVAQEVLAQVARSIRKFEYQPERGRFRDWLGTVTRHKLARYLKHKASGIAAKGGASVEIFESTAAPAADSEWTAEFNTHVLRTALDRVRPRFEAPTWKAFELVWIENRAARDVARELKQPIDFVYVAKSRVLKRLREEVLALAEDIPLFTPLHS